jgi:shikimate dehydrogenase
MTDHYAVVGNPVAHSLSPAIHAEFARQAGQDLDYVRLLAPLDGFAACVADFRAHGGKGVNVTLPFKLEAYRLATRLSDRAEQAQAVNTLEFDAGAIFGDNTDGAGLVRDIETNLGFALAGRHVLLMGAGGAARGAVLPLLEKRPATLVIANRTPDKAHALALHFARRGKCAACGYAELAGRRFDLVINATSASVRGGPPPPLPDDIFAPGALAYDMMYGKALTSFLRFAQAHGAARIADGIGMLVEQAAESFFIWRGVRPETAPVIALLKTQDRGSRIED